MEEPLVIHPKVSTQLLRSFDWRCRGFYICGYQFDTLLQALRIAWTSGYSMQSTLEVLQRIWANEALLGECLREKGFQQIVYSCSYLFMHFCSEWSRYLPELDLYVELHISNTEQLRCFHFTLCMSVLGTGYLYGSKVIYCAELHNHCYPIACWSSALKALSSLLSLPPTKSESEFESGHIPELRRTRTCT